MSRDFISNFEQPQKPQTPEPLQDASLSYETSSETFSATDYIRNATFIWPDGRRRFFSYNRLDSGEIDAEQSIIRLTFGAELVELSGIRLLALLESFTLHERKYVYCDDPRYNELSEDGPIVNKIVITMLR